MNWEFKKTVLFALALVFSLSSITVYAQLPQRISPWLLMMDRSRNTSGLDNYNRLVKPRQEMLRSYADQASQIQLQQQALRSMQSGTGGGSTGLPNSVGLTVGGAAEGGAPTNGMLLSAPREIPSSRSPAGFNQYLHYYPAGGLPRQPVPNFSTAGQRR